MCVFKACLYKGQLSVRSLDGNLNEAAAAAAAVECQKEEKLEDELLLCLHTEKQIDT